MEDKLLGSLGAHDPGGGLAYHEGYRISNVRFPAPVWACYDREAGREAYGNVALEGLEALYDHLFEPDHIVIIYEQTVLNLNTFLWFLTFRAWKSFCPYPV